MKGTMHEDQIYYMLLFMVLIVILYLFILFEPYKITPRTFEFFVNKNIKNKFELLE